MGGLDCCLGTATGRPAPPVAAAARAELVEMALTPATTAARVASRAIGDTIFQGKVKYAFKPWAPARTQKIFWRDPFDLLHVKPSDA